MKENGAIRLQGGYYRDYPPEKSLGLAREESCREATT